jgi:S-DNA-T family DNA segregation ATPase FtsK/SpoIIIE
MKKNKKKKERKISFKPELKEETKQTIVGIVFLGISVLFILSFFELAGPAGNMVNKSFTYLFGWMYFLFPLLILFAGIIFVSSFRKHIYLSTIIGLLLFFIGALGISDVIKQSSTGLLGRLIGSIEKAFDFWGSIVFCVVILIIGIIIVFEFSLRIKRKNKEKLEGKGEKEEEKEKIEEIEIEEIPEINIKEKKLKKREKIGEIKESDIRMDLKNVENWNFPSIELLESEKEKPNSGDIKTNSQIIRRTLSNFGISVEMDEINIGPTVTRYSLKPAEGVKLSRILSLQNDLSLSLAAHPIRIEAPIPGKSLVGIEVPNKSKADVRLKNMIAINRFWNSNLLSVPLGRDVSGESIFIDISKMPHLLVSGSTGSGKSVAIHSIIISLLFKNTPETLRLLLMDPKRVELVAYNNLPHLVSDVITKPKKAISALRWAVLEMEKRYEELEESKSRDIDSYNQKALKNKKTLMPYILIVIDELADLMASFGREVEGSIVRLAQMARATGIHLIVSTQRPSTEVITGLIKANIPARIALKVASQIDSRTILDMAGAEKLLGQGDLLFLAPENSKPKRVQSAFVSEKEVSQIVKFIVENNKEYTLEKSEKEDFEEVAGQDNRLGNNQIDFDNTSNQDTDELYSEAYRVIMEAKKASTSLLQRRLGIGYNRAARLIDTLEERGVISSGDGAKPREILALNENEFEEDKYFSNEEENEKKEFDEE